MYKIVKRIIDFLLSLFIIIFFLPFFVPLAILLKVTGEGYIFYLQERVGYRNTKFGILKFATMLKASPSLGTGSITVKNDWRLTPMGKWLRKTKINELPQIINVLLGDMSLVGPRPMMNADFLKYSPEIQTKITQIKPGLTGIAAIVFRNEEQYYDDISEEPHEFCKRVISPYKGSLELWYQDHMSLKTDLQILLLTFWVILFNNSVLPFKVFKNLPEKPTELQKS